jgi:hypothetical protein
MKVLARIARRPDLVSTTKAEIRESSMRTFEALAWKSRDTPLASIH